MPPQGYKRCKTCGEEKPVAEYHRHKNTKDRRAVSCKVCVTKRAVEWQRANPEQAAQNRKRWRKRNPESEKARRRRYKAANRDTVVARRKRHEQRHPDKTQARRKLEDAVQKGKIVKPSACESCGNETTAVDLHGHHTDYSKPLAVEWLCRTCHNAQHQSEEL